MRAGVAAGHVATARAGAEILAEGGSAADAAIAASLASCVAETVMTGLLGGGHAIHWDAATESATALDCFVTAPAGAGAALDELDVRFGEEIVRYAVGAGSVAVPGLPAGLEALHRAHGRLPWARLVEPALRLAEQGVALPPGHASCLAMLAPVFTLTARGREIYAPAGRVLVAGERLDQPGLAETMRLLRDEGAASVYSGTIARSLVQLLDGHLTAADLAAYEPCWEAPTETPYAGTRFLARRGLTPPAEVLARLPRLRGLDATARTLALVEALAGADASGHTTNLVAVDDDGNACVLTTSLGLGSGDFLPGLDLQPNSMLGEIELLSGLLTPGDRMASMMAPSLAIDDDGLALAIGSAGGSRLRSALVSVAAAILDERIDPQEAVERPRVHPAGPVVHAEPGADEDALSALERSGRPVRRWAEQHHYFGGVSAIARAGAAADPRRSGAVAWPSD